MDHNRLVNNMLSLQISEARFKTQQVKLTESCYVVVNGHNKSNVGKGSLWCIDPEFRPNLLQALQKAPSMDNLEFRHFSYMSSTYCQNGKTEFAEALDFRLCEMSKY
ncbi:forkhead box protein N3 [Caerostris extrusa]|uniref:Forkhead box protein N3 n=1 Tax=Caerostris extrusa TaxID=172846 RepID=A0AAV4UV77_CAEEX|nr:forkhead box protein N3 [Caerostris extrusa]